MIFDIDILIWVQRGSEKAAMLVDSYEKKYISVYTYLELMRGAVDKTDMRRIKDYIHSSDFEVLPLTENIGHRAMVYMEKFSLSSGLEASDAIIASTAMENFLPLCSGNKKHFKMFDGLDFKPFNP